MPTDQLEVVTQSYLPPRQPNPQLFENNVGLMNEYAQLQAEGGLHGQRPPNLAIVHQKPEHYVIVFLKGKGCNNREIAAKTGYTESWVSQITRQPWFVRELLKEIRSTGRDGMEELIRLQCEDSLLRVSELANTAKSEAVKLAANITLINRHLGTPTQHAEVKVSKDVSIVTRHESLQEELAELERQEKELRDKLLKINAA